MRIITFNKDNYKDVTTSVEKPVINIVRIVFNTSDSNWFQRFHSSLLTLIASSSNGQTITIPIIIGAFITPYHRQPVLEINLTEDFKNDSLPSSTNHGINWTTTVELTRLEFKENETLNVSIIERKHIQERIQDWKKRIDNLYSDISNWIAEQPGYTCKNGHPTTMFEDLMRTFEIPQQEIKTLDIYYNSKIILAFKPKGLWIIGANGRIDILSGKGSFMLIDTAEQFQPPLWQIYSTDKKTKNNFNKEVFLQILSLIVK